MNPNNVQRAHFLASGDAEPLEELAAHLRKVGLLPPDDVDPALGLKYLDGQASWCVPRATSGGRSTGHPGYVVAVTVVAEAVGFTVTVEARVQGEPGEGDVRPTVVRRRRAPQPPLPPSAVAEVYEVARVVHEHLVANYHSVRWSDPPGGSAEGPLEPR